MNRETLLRLCEHYFLIDEHFTSSDVDAVFAQVAPEGKQVIDLPQFASVIQLIVEMKDLHVDTICQAVMHFVGPTVRPMCAAPANDELAPFQVVENQAICPISCV